MNLYEISNEYIKAFDELSDMDGMTEEIISDTLSHIKDEFNEKAIAITSYFKNLEAEANAIMSAQRKMNERRWTIENKINNMKKYLRGQMIKTEIKKIKCPYFSITLAKLKKSVIIKDESIIPKEFLITREEVVRETIVDKNKILEYGGCDGVEIVEGYGLRIS